MNLYSEDINFLANLIHRLNEVNAHDGTLYIDRVPICMDGGELQGFLVDEADAWSWREATDDERKAYNA